MRYLLPWMSLRRHKIFLKPLRAQHRRQWQELQRQVRWLPGTDAPDLLVSGLWATLTQELDPLPLFLRRWRPIGRKRSMVKHKLRVGYVGTSIGSYFATEYGQRERAIAGLQKLAQEWDFELVAVADEVMTEQAAQQAAARLQDEHIDFLLLQTAACSAGEQLLPLAKCAPRL